MLVIISNKFSRIQIFIKRGGGFPELFFINKTERIRLSSTKGRLYIVATPIGNLADITYRAVNVLKQCSVIAAEDTRQTRHLLAHYSVQTPLISLHEHNEDTLTSELIQRVCNGDSVAVVSDAGTPLINDPGFVLVREARKSGLSVIPVPGPCAIIAALSVASLPTDRFSFEGFPPRNSSARKAFFKVLVEAEGTLVFYESCHRIATCLSDLAEIFPPERELVIARELTKIHETIVKTTVVDAQRIVNDVPYMQKGEFVVLLQGAQPGKTTRILDSDQERMLKIILEDCSLKTAVALVVKMTGLNKKTVYEAALRIAKR